MRLDLRYHALCSAAIIAYVAFSGIPAAAQTGGRAPAVSAAGLEEIVVTARRQSENLQSTPVSISALSSGFLDSIGLQGVDKIGQFVPNVALVEASGGIGGNVAYIRGVGASEPLLTVDSPIGVYLDGVYLGRQAANNLDLVDPERIEVLRGPQGTLFGRNTTGGAINIVTRRPAAEPGGEIKASYASRNDWNAKGVLDTGLLGSSGISATLAVQHRERNGFVDNPHTSARHDPGALRSTALWGKIHGEWAKLQIDISGDWNDMRGQRNPFQIVQAYPAASGYFSHSPAYGGDPFIVSKDRLSKLPFQYLGEQKSETFGTSLTATYSFSELATLKSISGWRGWNAFTPTNYAGDLRGPVVDLAAPSFFSIQQVSPFLSFGQELHQRQFSQELQLLGHSDSLSYVTGLYYFNERAREFNPTNFTLALPPAFLGNFGIPASAGQSIQNAGLGLVGVNLAQTLAYTTRSRSLAGFGQISWKPNILDQRLELTAGLRYTHDKRTIEQTSIPSARPIFTGIPTVVRGASRDAETSESNWSWLGSASFAWTPAFMTYVRVATGYRAGGFDARAGLNTATGVTFPFAFKMEKAITYEAGFKAETTDRRLRLNASLYHTSYDGLQVSQYAGGNGFMPNADARYRGFEVEGAAVPVDNMLLDASIGFTDAKYKKFLLVNPATGLEGDYADSAKFPYVPKWTLHIGGQQTFPLSAANLIVRVDYSYVSKRYFMTTTLLNPLRDAITDPGQDLLSARITLADLVLAGGLKAEISAFGENLLNNPRRLSGIDFGPGVGIAGVSFGEPRRFGVDLKLRF